MTHTLRAALAAALCMIVAALAMCDAASLITSWTEYGWQQTAFVCAALVASGFVGLAASSSFSRHR